MLQTYSASQLAHGDQPFASDMKEEESTSQQPVVQAKIKNIESRTHRFEVYDRVLLLLCLWRWRNWTGWLLTFRVLLFLNVSNLSQEIVLHRAMKAQTISTNMNATTCERYNLSESPYLVVIGRLVGIGIVSIVHATII